MEFRTRKAHRWVLRDVDLLKYLSSMIFAVVCYMSAFTASSIDLIQTAALEGLQEVHSNTCQQMKWEFVTQFSEILILAFGLHLAIASRNANTQFRVSSFLFTLFLWLLSLDAFDWGKKVTANWNVTHLKLPPHHLTILGATLSGCIDFSWVYCFGDLLYFARYLSEFMGSGHNIFNTILTLTIHKHIDNGSDISTKTLVST